MFYFKPPMQNRNVELIFTYLIFHKYIIYREIFHKYLFIQIFLSLPAAHAEPERGVDVQPAAAGRWVYEPGPAQQLQVSRRYRERAADSADTQDAASAGIIFNLSSIIN